MKVFVVNYLSDCSENGDAPWSKPVTLAKTLKEAWDVIKKEFDFWREQHDYSADDIPEDVNGDMSFTELFYQKTADSLILCDFGDFHIWNIYEMEFNVDSAA